MGGQETLLLAARYPSLPCRRHRRRPASPTSGISTIEYPRLRCLGACKTALRRPRGSPPGEGAHRDRWHAHHGAHCLQPAQPRALREGARRTADPDPGLVELQGPHRRRLGSAAQSGEAALLGRIHRHRPRRRTVIGVRGGWMAHGAASSGLAPASRPHSPAIGLIPSLPARRPGRRPTARRSRRAGSGRRCWTSDPPVSRSCSRLGRVGSAGRARHRSRARRGSDGSDRARCDHRASSTVDRVVPEAELTDQTLALPALGGRRAPRARPRAARSARATGRRTPVGARARGAEHRPPLRRRPRALRDGLARRPGPRHGRRRLRAQPPPRP